MNDVNLTPQLPAEGISLTGDYGTAKTYSIPCNCQNPDDEIFLEVEADGNLIAVQIFTKVKTKWWDERWRKRYDIDNKFLQHIHWFGTDFINGIWTRLRQTWNIWTKGYLEYESCTLLTQQQAVNLSNVLIMAVNDVTKKSKSKFNGKV